MLYIQLRGKKSRIPSIHLGKRLAYAGKDSVHKMSSLTGMLTTPTVVPDTEPDVMHSAVAWQGTKKMAVSGATFMILALMCRSVRLSGKNPGEQVMSTRCRPSGCCEYVRVMASRFTSVCNFRSSMSLSPRSPTRCAHLCKIVAFARRI